MDIIEFFDIENKEHLKAYAELQNKGRWPKRFIPKGTTFRVQWSLTLLYKMTAAYMKIMGVEQ